MDPKLLDILVHAYFMERSDGSVGWYTDQIAERHRILYDQVQDSIRRAKSYIRDQNMKDYKERLKTYSGEALLAESVDLLDLSEGARNGLMLVGITTIRQLTETTKDQLFHHRFMKKERIEEIKEKLAVYGLSLKQ